MSHERFRLLGFLTGTSHPFQEHNRTIIVRKGSYFSEIDGKFPNIEDGVLFMESLGVSSEICIIAREQPKIERDMNGIIREGIGMMEEEKYWLAHEEFEDCWKYYSGEKSRFFHGVVTMCVSMVHYQMGHSENAFRLFQNSKKELIEFLGGTVDEWKFSYPLPSTIVTALGERSLAIARE